MSNSRDMLSALMTRKYFTFRPRGNEHIELFRAGRLTGKIELIYILRASVRRAISGFIPLASRPPCRNRGTVPGHSCPGWPHS